MSSKTLFEAFKECFKDNSCVRVETFYEKLKTENNCILLAEKTEDYDSLKRFLVDKSGQLEVLAEGYRCLSQIYINLLLDFELFKICPIRKYSSAFNYISKIEGFKDILKNIGYVESEEEMKFNLKVDKIEDEDASSKRAYNLLVCFMELMEMIDLTLPGCTVPEIIEVREKKISANREERIDSKMTEGEKLALFKKCELCDEVMSDEGICAMCGTSVAEFKLAWKHRELLSRRFRIDINKFPSPPAAEVKEPKSEVPPRVKQDKPGGKQDTWACGDCTFKNVSTNINCEICGNVKS